MNPGYVGDGRRRGRHVTHCLLPRMSCTQRPLAPSLVGRGDFDMSLERLGVANLCGMATGPYCKLIAYAFFFYSSY